MKPSKPKPKKKTGPAPERVKFDGDWKDLAKMAMMKAKPKGGWPKK